MLHDRRHVLGSLNVVQLLLQLFIMDMIEVLPPVCLLDTLLPFLGYAADLVAELLVLLLLGGPFRFVHKTVFVLNVSAKSQPLHF